MVKLSLFLLAAPMAAASAVPAVAADETGERRAYVHYSDLDLSTAEARAALRARVARAAQKVCDGGSINRLTLGEQRRYVKCRTVALRSAEPQLALLFEGKKLASGGPLHVAAN